MSMAGCQACQGLRGRRRSISARRAETEHNDLREGEDVAVHGWPGGTRATPSDDRIGGGGAGYLGAPRQGCDLNQATL